MNEGQFIDNLLVGNDRRITEITAAAGLAGTGTVFRGYIERIGKQVYTRILIDLTGLASAADDNDVIGAAAGGVSYLLQCTSATTGAILGGRVTCLEVPATGADDIDFEQASVGTGEYDDDATALTNRAAVITKGGAWALGASQSFGPITEGYYLYLAAGEAVGGTYTAGRFLIELFGYV
jgi:hypothetical protein